MAVGEERAVAIPYILSELPDTSLILLDDAFQHRAVKPDFSVLLTTYSRPFYTDTLLPGGRLREARSGAARADAVIMTKCPESLKPTEMEEIRSQINRYAPDCPVFFCTVHYSSEVPALLPLQPVILVTGIANASGMADYVASSYQLKYHMEYADHYRFTEGDISKIVAKAKEHGASVLTTEKDFMRLKSFTHNWENISVHYVPIEMVFLKDGAKFDGLVRKVLTTHL